MSRTLVQLPADYIEHLYEVYKEQTYEIFVQAAPMTFVKSYNTVYNALTMTNGHQLRGHSLQLHYTTIDTKTELIKRIREANPGEIVDIPTPSTMQVMILRTRPHDAVSPQLNWPASLDVRRTMPANAITSAPVVPLSNTHRVIVRVPRGRNSRKIMQFRFAAFPAEITYAFSYYKGQRQTLDRYICDVGYHEGAWIHNLTYNELLVGLNRCRKPLTDLRLFPVPARTLARTQQHLLSLRPPRLLAEYRSHFKPKDPEHPYVLRYERAHSLAEYSDAAIAEHRAAEKQKSTRARHSSELSTNAFL